MNEEYLTNLYLELSDVMYNVSNDSEKGVSWTSEIATSLGSFDLRYLNKKWNFRWMYSFVKPFSHHPIHDINPEDRYTPVDFLRDLYLDEDYQHTAISFLFYRDIKEEGDVYTVICLENKLIFSLHISEEVIFNPMLLNLDYIIANLIDEVSPICIEAFPDFKVVNLAAFLYKAFV